MAADDFAIADEDLMVDVEASSSSDDDDCSDAFGDVDVRFIKKVAVIGSGRFGTVYRLATFPLYRVMLPVTVTSIYAISRFDRAIDMKADREVAVKLIAIDADEQTKRNVESEVNVLSRCNSPFIIKFYGAYFEDGNNFAICTEFMDGNFL